MQEGIAQGRLLSEPPDVLLSPQLGPFGPFEYHRAAVAIAEGREAVALMLAAIHTALIGPPVAITDDARPGPRFGTQ
jgi:NTE family protein